MLLLLLLPLPLLLLIMMMILAAADPQVHFGDFDCVSSSDEQLSRRQLQQIDECQQELAKCLSSSEGGWIRDKCGRRHRHRRRRLLPPAAAPAADRDHVHVVCRYSSTANASVSCRADELEAPARKRSRKPIRSYDPAMEQRKPQWAAAPMPLAARPQPKAAASGSSSGSSSGHGSGHGSSYGSSSAGRGGLRSKRR